MPEGTYVGNGATEHADPQRFSHHVYYDTEERENLALCTEFPLLSAYGNTPQEASSELDVALAGALDVHVIEGWPIPESLSPPPPGTP